LQRLVSSTGELSAKLAGNAGNLGGAVSNTAQALRQVASERSALQDALQRTPAVLTQAKKVLGDTDTSLTTINPALSALAPVAPKVATLLRLIVPFGTDFIPALNQIHALIPSAEHALNGFVPVERQGVPALQSLTSALTALEPILTGLRPYAPDVTAGFFNGVGGSAFGGYDANGHYLSARAVLQGGAASLSGLLSVLGKATLGGPLDGARTGQTAPCPGGGGPPAPDGSNPWISTDGYTGGGVLCNPSNDVLP
ncbi:MAG TPA: hypothetical protein VG223_13390, partial [Solirubrobacteraceae bacterium]|nr:hypothetical protein [Solirubrobacteraceae bacterium]